MSTLAQLAAETKVWMPEIDPLACQTLVQRAYRDIRRSRDWSFLKQNGVWFAPSVISSGTCSVTFLSTQVVFDSVAAPLLNAVAITPQPEQPLTLRQFRVTGGPIYNIIAWNGVNTATLDRSYTEQTLPSTSYMVYQPFVQAPSSDFKRWLSWVDPLNNYRFRYRNLFWTQAEVDKRDPARQSYSIPIAIASHDYVTLPGTNPPVVVPRFEAWPHPVQQIGYVIQYMINGDSVTLTTPLPSQVTDETIMARARYYGNLVVAGQPNVDVKVKAFHMAASRQAEAEYVDLLNRDRLADTAIWDSTVVSEESGPVLSGPIDSEFLMSHVLYLVE
jgi:hypothetical protein